MTIYARNFKDEISFAREYASPRLQAAGCFSGGGEKWVTAKEKVGGERRTKFSSRHPWDRVGPRIIQRFAFVTRQHGVTGETWRGSRQRGRAEFGKLSG